MKKALFVIDMQNIFIGEKHRKYYKYDCEGLIDSVNSVIEANKDNLVIYIYNLTKDNFFSKLLPFHACEGSEEARLVKLLQIESNYAFSKYKGNAFTNPALNPFLKEHEIDCIEVVGIDGGGCVSLTALGAIENGYHVIKKEKAIGTMLEKRKEKYFKKLEHLGAEFQ